MACNDQAALQEFYDRYYKLVFSFTLKILNCRSEAEEVMLEGFWQVWQQAGNYSQERGSVSAWLIMMARSRAIDRRRSRERSNAMLQIVDKDDLDTKIIEGGRDPEEHYSSLE